MISARQWRALRSIKYTDADAFSARSPLPAERPTNAEMGRGISHRLYVSRNRKRSAVAQSRGRENPGIREFAMRQCNANKRVCKAADGPRGLKFNEKSMRALFPERPERVRNDADAGPYICNRYMYM